MPLPSSSQPPLSHITRKTNCDVQSVAVIERDKSDDPLLVIDECLAIARTPSEQGVEGGLPVANDTGPKPLSIPELQELDLFLRSLLESTATVGDVVAIANRDAAATPPAFTFDSPSSMSHMSPTSSAPSSPLLPTSPLSFSPLLHSTGTPLYREPEALGPSPPWDSFDPFADVNTSFLDDLARQPAQDERNALLNCGPNEWDREFPCWFFLPPPPCSSAEHGYLPERIGNVRGKQSLRMCTTEASDPASHWGGQVETSV
ncbi:hypothetical protein OH77DRAFT_1516399 [Trametes cingulata]|nr:hypothetical protein OH77DRAFT_1516399 [Trametes cingulata]